MHLEAHTQRAIVEYLRLAGVYVVAVPNAATRRPGARAGNAVPGLTAGFPDLLVFPGDGRVAALEVKAPPKRLASGKLSEAAPRVTPEQVEQMTKLHALGVPAYVVRSITDVERIAEANGWIRRRAEARYGARS